MVRKVKRELTKKEICKGLEIGSITAELAANVATDVNSIPVIGEFTGIFTAGTAIASHTVKAGLDITRAVMECDDINFDEIKEILDKKFTEVERKLDQITDALNVVSEMVSKTLSAVEKARQEMKEGFTKILDVIESSKIEDVVLKIKSFVEYFEGEKERIQSLEKEDYTSDLQESGLLNYLKTSRTPMGDSLQSAIFEILEQQYAIPDDKDDKSAISALNALHYGIQAYVEVMYFLIEKYAYLANECYKKYDIKKFNSYFNLIKTTFNGFKFTFIGTVTTKGLIDKVIDTFDKAMQRNVDENTNKYIIQQTKSLNTMKVNIKNMTLPIIEQTPENTIEIAFTLPHVNVPIGEWKTGARVKYALQYEQDGKFSKVSDWTEDFTVAEKANPFLKLSVDPNRRTRLVFRRFNSEKPKLVGIVDPYTVEFRDINRDLYDATGSVNEQSVQNDIIEFIKNGADIGAIFEKGRKAIHAAAQHGNSEIAQRFILNANVQIVNAIDSDGYTPLHLAADAGRDEFVSLLINAGSDVNARTTTYELTPLHLAVRKGYEKSAKNLMTNNKLNINQKNIDGFTPLHTAIIGGYKIVEVLCTRPEIDLNAKSNTGLTPFHLAVMKNDKAVVEALLEINMVDVNAVDKNNMTALHFACMVGYTDMVRLLLNVIGINANIKSIENEWTPLYYAIFFKHSSTVLEILKINEIEVNLTTNGNVTPLHLAIAKGLTDVALELLKKGALADKATTEGIMPIHAAAFKGESILIPVLHAKGANIDAKTKEGLTPLHMAAISGHLEAVKSLMELGADVGIKDSEGYTYFYLAVQNGNIDIVKYAVENKKIDINSNDNWRPQQGKGLQKVSYWAVCDAINFGKIEIVKYLVGKLKNYVCSPLRTAAESGHLDIVKYLVEEEHLDINGEPGSYPPVIAAADGSHLNIVKYLIEKGVDVNTDFHGMFLVTIVVIRGNFKLLQYLVDKGVKIDIKTQFGGTLLHEAVAINVNVLKFLVEQNKININAQDSEGNTALHVAADYNDVASTNYLCSKGADITIKNNAKKTAFDLYQKHGITPKCLIRERYFRLKRKEEPILKGSLTNRKDANSLEFKNNDTLLAEYSEVKTNDVKEIKGFKLNTRDNLKSLLKIHSIPYKSSEDSRILKVDGMRNIDVNGSVLLLDLLLRKITDSKLNFINNKPVTLLNARADALSIVKIFDSVFNTANKDVDLFELYSAIRGALMSENREKLLDVLSRSVESFPKQKVQMFFSLLKKNALN